MIVVTGATGNVGRSLTAALTLAGEQVTAVARTVPEAGAPDGVSYVSADLGRPDTLRPALEGADALFLLVAGDGPGDVLDIAKASGVERVVLLSSQGARTRPHAYRHPVAFEDAVRQSALSWTILRSGGFDSNAFAWAQSIREQRVAAAPFGDVGLPTVDPADVADVAAAVLRDPAHSGAVYELTGPEPTTPRTRVRAIADALGEPVRFVEQTREEAREMMLRFMPEPVVEGTLGILGEPTPDEQAVSPDVERVLGRAPRTFADWAARNLGAFR